MGKKIDGLSQKAIKILMAYNYPGNVRELRNIIEYAFNICEDRQIKSKHLPSYLLEETSRDLAGVTRESPIRLAYEAENNGVIRTDSHQEWQDVERQMIMEALIKTGGRRNKAAVSLGWARSTLWRKMKYYGIH